MNSRVLSSAVVLLCLLSITSTILAGYTILVFPIADGGPSWVHRNSVLSLIVSAVLCVIEMLLTALAQNRLRVYGTIAGLACVAVLVSGAIVGFLGPWLLIVSGVSFLWNTAMCVTSTIESK